MRIGGLIKFSLIDYPNKLAAVVFTQGCNFRCPYCHNPELVDPSLFNDPLPEEEVLTFLNKRRGQLEGVVVTGGEPTIQIDLKDFVIKIKSMGYAVKLDTNGSRPKVIKELIAEKLIDYIAMDVKAPFEKYDMLAGVAVSAQCLKESIAIISTSNVEHEFRTTFVAPLLNWADLDCIRALCGKSHFHVQEFVERENLLARVID